MDESAIPELAIEQVAARLGEPGFYVIDNNAPARWKRSHVPGALQLDPYSFAASELPRDLDATLVFYCSGPG